MAGRGSAKLIEHWKSAEINEAALKRLSAAVDELELVGILSRGIPWPEWLRADLTLASDDPERCGNVVAKILGALGGGLGVPHVIVFPKGIPVIDGFNLRVEFGAP